MLHADGHVQHVDLERRAVAPGRAGAGRPRGDDFRTCGVILHRGEAFERFLGVADDASRPLDEGDARVEKLAEPVRFAVERGGRGRRSRRLRRALVEHLAGQLRLGDERLFDARVGLRSHRRGEERAGDDQREQGRRQRREKQFDRNVTTLIAAAARAACSRTVSP